MRSENHPTRYWLIQVCAHAAGAAFLLLAGALILQAFAGGGSSAGNILRVALAICSLFIGFFCFVIGTVNRLLFRQSRGTALH
jgi:hypothetical protein